MKIAVAALTKNGSELACKIGQVLKGDIFLKPEFIEGNICSGNVFAVEVPFKSLVGEMFHKYDAFIFIMAAGIVVRSIAPWLESKTTDPAVIVMDEKGKYAVSLLSGHIGGANRLAMELAGITGGEAVLTTSTDVNEVIAFDLFAVENNLIIENIGNLKYISSELVNGRKVGFYCDGIIKGKLPENILHMENAEIHKCKNVVAVTNQSTISFEGAEKILYLRPKNLIFGIGCKRGTAKEQIEAAVIDFLNKNNRCINSIGCIATIDLKKDEAGLVEFCKEKAVPLKIISREEVKSIEKDFTCSEFVKEKIGVAGVAEPCALLASKSGRLIIPKTVYKGITLALVEEESEYYI